MVQPRSRRAFLQLMAAVGGSSAGLPSLGHAATPPLLLHTFGTWPPRVERVFAAGPPAALLLTVLAPERLLGWPMPLPEAAKPMLPPAVRDKPVLGRLSGRGSTVSLEALLALRPDAVLDAGTVDATYLSALRRVAEQTGLPCVLADGRLADTPAQLRELGALLGVAARARELAAYADDALAQAPAPSPRSGGGAATARPGVYLARGPDGLETALAGAINAELIELAGGRNVAATGQASGIARVSMEQLLAWSPDWVLTQDAAFFRRAQADALWRTLPAVKEGRLLLAPHLPFGWLDGPPGVNRLLGLRWLAACLRQGRPAQREALDEALRFHALFYGLAPPRDMLQAMLEGRA